MFHPLTEQNQIQKGKILRLEITDEQNQEHTHDFKVLKTGKYSIVYQLFRKNDRIVDSERQNIYFDSFQTIIDIGFLIEL